MQIAKPYGCCLFLQLHSLLYGHYVYIAPFSIMLGSSICHSNSFLAFKHRSLLFWLCSNMAEPLRIETHDKGDLQLFFSPILTMMRAPLEQWVWKYHQGRGAFTHAASVMKYKSLRLTIFSFGGGGLTPASVILLVFVSILPNVLFKWHWNVTLLLHLHSDVHICGQYSACVLSSQIYCIIATSYSLFFLVSYSKAS